MATAVRRFHDVLDNRMHLDAFGPSPSKPRRRRQAKPAAAASSPPKTPAAPKLAAPKMAAVSSPPPKPAAPRMAAVSSPPPKPAMVASPVPKAASSSRRSPPARPARKQPSPTKEKPKNRIVKNVRILKRPLRRGGNRTASSLLLDFLLLRESTSGGRADMATAMLRSHGVLDNRMHLDAFGASPSKPCRRRQAKPAAAASSPPKTPAVVPPAPKPAAPKMAAVSSSPLKPAAPKMAAVSSPPPKPAMVASPVPKAASSSRRSPPARPARKQPSPTKEKPKNRIVKSVWILKCGDEPPAQAPDPSPAPAQVPVVSQAAPKDQRVLCTTRRIGPHEPAVVQTKIAAVAGNAAGYAGPPFSAAAPEPSSLPFPAFFLGQAEAEATRGLRFLRIGELS